MRRIALAALILGCTAAAAGASQQAVGVMNKWKAMDKCTTQAQAAHPDFTPEANAKRDAQVKDCLAGQALPPREPASPPK